MNRKVRREESEKPRKKEDDCLLNNFSLSKFSLSLCLCSLIFLASIKAQDLPDEIRGYKVYQAKVSVQTRNDEKKSNDDLRVVVNFDAPELVEVTPLGGTFEISAELTVFGQSARIDFLTFRDFRVNGLKVEIEEYREPFEIEKNKPLRLKKPFRIFLSTTQAVKGGLKEFLRSENEWQASGRVFVFGKFKKIGFHFKRVVPLDVNLKIANPLKSSGTNLLLRNNPDKSASLHSLPMSLMFCSLLR